MLEASVKSDSMSRLVAARVGYPEPGSRVGGSGYIRSADVKVAAYYLIYVIYGEISGETSGDWLYGT